MRGRKRKFHGKHWSESDIESVANNLHKYAIEQMYWLGRSPGAIRAMMKRKRIYPNTQEWLTSGQAAELAGISVQMLTRKARQGKVIAARPNSRWWLFDPNQFAKDEFADWLEIPEVQARTGRAYVTIAEWAQQGKVRAVKVIRRKQRRWVFHPQRFKPSMVDAPPLAPAASN